MTRGQIVLSDLVFGIVIFLILMTTFIVEWTRLNGRLEDKNTFDELELLTFQIADLLIKQPGTPSDWETSPPTVDVLGLAETDRILSPAKVLALQNLSYDTTRTLLNVERFELYILLQQHNSAIIEIGSVPTKRAVHIRRYVTYANKQATLDIALSEQ